MDSELQPENIFIRRLRTLTGLGEEELDAFANLVTIKGAIAAERSLLTEGEQPQRMHILLDGWAARVKLLPDGRRHFCALLLPGDICDVDGLHVQFYDYGVTALTPCTVASVDRRELLALFDTYPRIARALTWLGFVDNSLLNELTVSLARRSARQRVAHLFCELVLRLKATGGAQGDQFELRLTQEKVGDALGLTSVHINRIYRQLRDEGLINVMQRSIRIRDWDALKRTAGFSPGYLHLEGMR